MKIIFFLPKFRKKGIQWRLTVKNDEIIRVSGLNLVRNEPSCWCSYSNFQHLLSLNSLISRLIIYLTFCCFALILLLVDSKEEYGVLIFSSHSKQSTTFFVITESFHIKAWQEAWWSMEQTFYLFKILAILLLTFEHLFFVSFQFHAYFLKKKKLISYIKQSINPLM